MIFDNDDNVHCHVEFSTSEGAAPPLDLPVDGPQGGQDSQPQGTAARKRCRDRLRR